jgi:predicted hydrocarbon binding protein
MESLKYQFNWSLIGDINLGRPNLGNSTSVEMYRLMQFTFREVVEKKYGKEKADEIFYESGYISGKAFFDQYITRTDDMNHFLRQLQEALKILRVGILRIEELNLDKGTVLMTVSEDLDCSGLPEAEYEVCKYDEGFIAALFEKQTGNCFEVKEIDCWTTGDRTCRFRAQKR